MRRLGSIARVFIAILLVALSQPSMQACTACFGKSDSNLAKGMNMGIFALLLVITAVLCGVAGFFVFLAKRSSEIENAKGVHAMPAEQTNA